MVILETIAILFSLLYVFLAAKENNLCWAAAIISVSIYIYICFNAKLYSETLLQVFYLFMAFYGLLCWKKKEGNTSVVIKEWHINKHITIIIIGLCITFLAGFYFSTYTDARMPVVDSFTTIFSVFATYMVINKVLENWLYWIVIDVTSIYLYNERGLDQTAILFILYTIIAFFGYFSWNKRISTNG